MVSGSLLINIEARNVATPQSPREACMGFPIEYTKHCVPKSDQTGMAYEDVRDDGHFDVDQVESLSFEKVGNLFSASYR